MRYELSQVVDTLDGLVWTASADGLVDFVNRRWCDYTGLALEQVRGQGWQSVFHSEDLPTLLQDGASSRASGEPHDTEARMRRFDGVYRWFLIRALPLADPAGQVVGWCGLNIDIEERRRVVEALQMREQELRDVFDRIPGFVAVADSQGRHEYANSRTLAYTHNTLEKVRGLGFIRSLHPDEQESVRNLWLRCVALGEAMDVEHRMRRFDGSCRWFHARVEPFHDERGQVIRWYGLLTDIDEQRRAEMRCVSANNNYPARCRSRRQTRGGRDYTAARPVRKQGWRHRIGRLECRRARRTCDIAEPTAEKPGGDAGGALRRPTPRRGRPGSTRASYPESAAECARGHE